ncbi:MAG TPA: hypothetical protein VJN18_33340 [Polyangiaceae bacterium]|nr:hypothetical protein [Polyangiaceae bacterium]
MSGTKLALAGTSSYDLAIARFAEQLWQLLAGTITTGSVALERDALRVLSALPAAPLVATESPEEKQRLDAARAEWARAFSARVETMRAMISGTNAVDAPTPTIPGDE